MVRFRIPMKKVLILFCIMPMLLITNQIFAEWSDPIVIGEGRNLDFAIDKIRQKIHVVHVVNDSRLMYYTKVDYNGNIEVEKELIPTGMQEAKGTNYGPRIAVDLAGNPHVLYRGPVVSDYGDLYYIVRTDGEWSTPLQLEEHILRGANTRIAIDNSNVVHIVHTNKIEPFLDIEIFTAVQYKQIRNGAVYYTQTVTDTVLEQRFDSPLAMTIDPNNNVYLILSDPHLHNSFVTLFKKPANSNAFHRVGSLLHEHPRKRHGHPDIVSDQNGTLHVCYGVQEDTLVQFTSSVRYVRLENENIVRHLPMTNMNELKPWSDQKVGWGLGTIAASDDGIVIGIAYQLQDRGELRVRLSQNRGATWQSYTKIVNICGAEVGVEGRDMQMMRSDGDRFFLLYPNSNPQQIMMRINDDVRVAPAAPSVTDASVSGDHDLKLSMAEDLAVGHYNIYRGQSADFEVDGTSLLTSVQTDYRPSEDGFQWIDTNTGVGDADHNYFYAVTGVSGTKESEPSAIVGEFDYEISTSATTDFNPVGLAMNNSQIVDAKSLLELLPTCNSIAEWIPQDQLYRQYIPDLPNSNFSIVPGHAYYVNAVSNSTLSFTGTASDPSFVLYTTTTTNFNDIMIPLDRSDLQTAEDLAEDIGACDAVVRFDVAAQNYTQYDYVDGNPGFDVQLGGVYKVNVTDLTIWPSSISKVIKIEELQSSSPYTQAPHTVRGKIQLGNLYHMRAFIKERPDEVQTDESFGSFVSDDAWCVQVGNFKSAWKAGDILRVEFIQKSNITIQDVIEIPLTYHACDRPVRTCCNFSDAESNVQLPDKFEVSHNFPNPFNGQTAIKIAMPEPDNIKVKIFDVLGKQIRVLQDGKMEAGYHILNWDGLNNDGSHVSSGLYFYQVQKGSSIISKKMILTQ